MGVRDGVYQLYQELVDRPEGVVKGRHTTDLLAALRSGKRIQVGKIVGEVPAYA